MKNLKKLLGIALITIISTTAAFAAPKTIDVMEKLDDIFELDSDFSAEIVMLQQRVKQGKKILKMKYFRSDETDSFTIIMLNEEDKGDGYLRIGDNFWMYKKNTGTFQHVNRDESIGDSDVKGGDLEKKKFTEQYKPQDKYVEEIEYGKNKIPAYKFTVIAKVKDVTYPKRVYWVSRDTYLPIKTQSYALSGKLDQTSYYGEYAKYDGKYVMKTGKFIDEIEKGNVTIFQMKSIKLDKIPDNVFTKAYLREASQ